jgi:hypothetical protein
VPTEIIGEFGTQGADLEWLSAEPKLAIKQLKSVCGEPPPEIELEVVWQEHELGNYPVIGLSWDPFRGAPSNCIARCEVALTAYENGGELPPGWTMPTVKDEDIEEEPFDPKKPPEPPDTLNFFEWQRSIFKLIEWSLDYAAYPRNRPQLVGAMTTTRSSKDLQVNSRSTRFITVLCDTSFLFAKYFSTEGRDDGRKEVWCATRGRGSSQDH